MTYKYNGMGGIYQRKKQNIYRSQQVMNLVANCYCYSKLTIISPCECNKAPVYLIRFNYSKLLRHILLVSNKIIIEEKDLQWKEFVNLLVIKNTICL